MYARRLTTVVLGENDTGKSCLIKSIYSAFGADPAKINPTWVDAKVDMLVCAPLFVHIAHETAGAARTPLSLRPPFLKGAKDMQASGAVCRENAKLCFVVVAGRRACECAHALRKDGRGCLTIEPEESGHTNLRPRAALSAP
jgi:hypothetical protein